MQEGIVMDMLPSDPGVRQDIGRAVVDAEETDDEHNDQSINLGTPRVA